MAAAVLLATASVSPPAGAEPSPAAAPGVAAYEAGAYERAYDLLRPAADAGDVQARYLMARLLGRDLNERTDYERSLYYLDQVTRCWSAEALNFFAGMVVQSETEPSRDVFLLAAHLYKEAAAAGELKALYNLGLTIVQDLRMPVLGASYVYEAAQAGHQQSADSMDRIKDGASGDAALQKIEKMVRDQPFEVRWPALTSFEKQCVSFSAP